jgi:hypothetical protein
MNGKQPMDLGNSISKGLSYLVTDKIVNNIQPESPHVDKFLEKLFLQEIEQQCEFADRAYNGIKEGLSLQSIGQVFSSLQSFLIAIANFQETLKDDTPLFWGGI